MRKYDIFISCKSEDYAKAEPIYYWLVEQGYNPFFAPVSLQTGTTFARDAFDKDIDDALEQVDNMIVFTSKAEYVESGYVEEEWRLFVGEKRKDRKQGNIVTILEGVMIDSLPLKLRNVQSFTLDAYKNGLLRYMWSRGEQKDVVRQTPVQTKPTVKKHKEIIPFKVGDVEFKMVYVEGGTFMMGATAEQDSDAYDDEMLAHKVTLSDYYIGETQVTQALWKVVMGNDPSYFKGDDNRPVEQVSWKVITEKFIPALNNHPEVKSHPLVNLKGLKFRLPTEAEWEYAARGGNKSKGFKYSGSDNIDEVAWYGGNSRDKIHPVKRKRENELDLYDMSGNVWEWCRDWYGDYSSGAQTNPQGPDMSYNGHVIRGGSWLNSAGNCRVSTRHYMQGSRSSSIGFRLVLCP